MPGILPYVNFNPMTGTSTPDEQWVMISQERGGKNKGEWDFFNGSVDAGETLKEAAAREGYEESLGLFGKIDQLRSKMMQVSNSGFLLNAEDLKSKADILKHCTPEEYLKRKKLSKFKSGCYQEKTEVKWVKLADLVDACRQKDHLLPDGKRQLKIRGSLANLVNKNASKIFKLMQSNQKLHAVKKAPAIVIPMPDNAAKEQEKIELALLILELLQYFNAAAKKPVIETKDALKLLKPAFSPAQQLHLQKAALKKAAS